MTTTRRALLAAVPVAAVAALPLAAMPMPLASPGNDAEILAAWERWREAHAVYDALPFADEIGLEPGTRTPDEAEQWGIIDEAQAVLATTKAATPEGAAIQLWVALWPSNHDGEVVRAIFRRDLAWFEANESDFDWDVRLILAALRSLQAQGAAL